MQAFHMQYVEGGMLVNCWWHLLQSLVRTHQTKPSALEGLPGSFSS